MSDKYYQNASNKSDLSDAKGPKELKDPGKSGSKYECPNEVDKAPKGAKSFSVLEDTEKSDL